MRLLWSAQSRILGRLTGSVNKVVLFQGKVLLFGRFVLKLLHTSWLNLGNGVLLVPSFFVCRLSKP